MMNIGHYSDTLVSSDVYGDKELYRRNTNGEQSLSLKEASNYAVTIRNF